jgi:hypothetical protein
MMAMTPGTADVYVMAIVEPRELYLPNVESS